MSGIVMAFVYATVIFGLYKILDILLWKPKRDAERKARIRSKTNALIIVSLSEHGVSDEKIGKVAKIMAENKDKEEI